MVLVFLFLPSFSMIISRSIHVAADGVTSFFFWLSNIPLHVYVPHLLYPFICRHCFHVLTVLNSAAMNIRYMCLFNHSFVWIYAQDWGCWVIWQLHKRCFLYLLMWSRTYLYCVYVYIWVCVYAFNSLSADCSYHHISLIIL